MPDLRITVTEQGSDLVLSGGDLAVEEGLETAVLLSLFTDRRARELPEGETDPRGWWAEAQDDRWGSQLWTLSRSKLTRANVERARAYALEALAWLTADGILERVEVDVQSSDTMLLLEVRLVRGSATRWPSVWAGVQEATYKPEVDVELHLLPL
jgi:phage gp46-like protein